jgi:hypothetical protein
LNVAPATDPLARLRIIKHGILAVDFMFDLEIARVRSIPMALQRRPHGSIIHLNLPPTHLAIISGPAQPKQGMIASTMLRTPCDEIIGSHGI